MNMRLKGLLACGILYAVHSVAADIVAAVRFEGYSYRDQAISELSAIGSPLQGTLLVDLVFNAALLTAFGWGVWAQAGGRPARRRTGTLLMALGVSHLAWPFFPMHARGDVTTMTDIGHLVVTAVTVALIIAAIWSGSRTFDVRFHGYSVTTIVVLLAAGAGTALYAPRVAANLSTPWMGLLERVNYYGFMLWIVVFAVMMLREPDPATLRRAA
jgi:hypothetical protein